MLALRQHFIFRFAFWVLLAPLLLASSIPAGVMPAMSATGMPTIVICTGDGLVEIAIDPLTGAPLEEDDSDPGNADQCDWGSSRATDGVSPPTSIVARTAGAIPAFLPALSSPLLAAIATGLPPATGPPTAV